MKNCPHCNTLMEDNAFYCPACGQRMSEPAAAPADNDAFYVFRRNLRHERKCWGIFGGVYLGIAIFFLAFALIYLMIGAGTEIVFAVISLVYLLCGGIFLAVAIVNKSIARKLDTYLGQIETCPDPALDRAVSVGQIVLAAIFNTLAMVFVILNHVHVKNNADLIRSR